MILTKRELPEAAGLKNKKTLWAENPQLSVWETSIDTSKYHTISLSLYQLQFCLIAQHIGVTKMVLKPQHVLMRKFSKSKCFS